jgi:DNA uptake protein ComE-like DNA-binding protein
LHETCSVGGLILTHNSISLGQKEKAAINLNASLKLNIEADILFTLNNGSVKDLMKMNSIGKKRAESIIRFRDSERHLTQLSDLRLCGFTEKLVDRFLKDNLLERIQFM